jgi:hypothetical protein
VSSAEFIAKTIIAAATLLPLRLEAPASEALPLLEEADIALPRSSKTKHFYEHKYLFK